MRILHLPSSFLPDSLGGTEVYVDSLAREQARLGDEVCVVHHHPRPAKVQMEGYQSVQLPPHEPRNRGQLYRLGCGKEPAGFSELLDDWRPDVAHFHAITFGAGPDHAAVLVRRGIPYLFTYHTPGSSCRRGTLLRFGDEPCDGLIDPKTCSACALDGQGMSRVLANLLARSPLPWNALPDGPWTTRLALPSLLMQAKAAWRGFIRGAAHLIACADWCRRLLIRNGAQPGQISVQRQALPGEERTRRLRLPLATDHPWRLGFLGRVTHMKGPDLFVEGIRLLQERHPGIQGEIVGPIGVGERTWLDHLTSLSGGSVKYLGVKRGQDLSGWLDSLDLAVIPSRCQETGPLTLLESWDRELPVVGAALGGIEEFMSQADLETLLFLPQDPAALAEAVERAAQWAGPPPTVRVGGTAHLAACMRELYERSQAIPLRAGTAAIP